MVIAKLDPLSTFAVVSAVLALFLFVGFLIWNRRKRSAGGGGIRETWSDASNDRRKILFYSLAAMLVITLAVGVTSTWLLYQTALDQQRQRLVETVESEARMIEAVARFDAKHSRNVTGGSAAATISQVVDAHQHQSGLGETGEFTLARLEEGDMVFLLERRHPMAGSTLRIPFEGSTLAEPMRRALSGKSGTIVSEDYRGETVLAAYEPVSELGLGIVAKIDLDEIRRPFIRTSLVGLGVATLLILCGGFFLVWVNSPLIQRIEDREKNLNAIVTNVADGIFTIDEQGNILTFNQSAESIYGYSADEVIGQSVGMLIEGVDDDIKPQLARLRGEHQEGFGRRKSGETFPMDVAVNPMDQGESPTYVGIARDITRKKRMEEELHQVNFLSDIALDLTGCGYWHVDYSDPDHYYQSERAALMLGEPLKPDMRYHLQDEWFARLIEANPETAELTSERYQGAIDGKYDQYESIYAYKRPADGNIIWLHAMGKVVRDDAGKIQFMYGAYQDITERKRAEQALQSREEQYRTLVGNIPGVVYRCLPRHPWTMLFISDEIENLSGYSASDFLGENPLQTFGSLIHPEDIEPIAQNTAEALRQRQPYNNEYRVTDSSGVTHWVYAKGKAIYDEDGNAKYLDGTIFDITDRKHAEMAMQKAQRAAEEASERAVAASRAKSDFLSHMSHELRTPLNGILGYAQILERDKQVTGGQKNHVKSIVNCGEHLLTLINDVLDLSKIEAGRLEVDERPANLHKLIQSVGDIVGQRARGKGLEFRIEVSPEVPQNIVTDAAKLRQILINLAGNAVKFTDNGSVTVRIAEDPRESLLLEVIDTGVGMGPEELEVIFDAFKQVEAGKDAGGTGLGLSISKRLAEALGGGIDVQSTPGQGSTFAVSIPLVEASDDEATALSGDGDLYVEDVNLAPGQQFTILVADDRDTNRDVLQALLQNAGFDVELAEDGVEALEVLHSKLGEIDLVLMDVRMPRMNGIEATQKIRADENTKDLKVIAVTASVFPEFREQAIKSGFDDFLGKPFRADDLMQKLQYHLSLQFVSEQTGVAEPSTTAKSVADGSPNANTENLSSDMINRLRQALQIKSLTAIKSLAGELMGHPDTQQLGQQISEYAGAFNFAKLKELAEQLEQSSA